MADALTSELDAVNIILGALGEAPVATLIGTLPGDVAVAYRTLTEIRKRILMLGWDCNTEKEVQLALNQDGEVVIAPTVLKIELSATGFPGDQEITQRGKRLYDKKNRTYVFASAPLVDQVVMLGWDELPEQLRIYVALKAARVFQARTLGAPELAGFTVQDENEARIAWLDADGDSANYNMLRNPQFARSYQYRR